MADALTAAIDALKADVSAAADEIAKLAAAVQNAVSQAEFDQAVADLGALSQKLKDAVSAAETPKA